MSNGVTRPSALVGARRYLAAVMPTGQSLPFEAWQGRHRALTLLLWFHAVALSGAALVRGLEAAHSVAEIGILVVLAVCAGWSGIPRTVRSGLVTFGLITSSAILVHVSGGTIEAHFHFFVMIAPITLYEEWSLYLLAIVYVILHHGILGGMYPEAVYNHPDAWVHPWKWAVIHGLFVLSASSASILTWRISEVSRAKVSASEQQFRDLFDEAPLGYHELDTEGRITRVNHTELAMLGYGEAEMLGHYIWEFADDPDDMRLAVQARLASGQTGHSIERLYRCKDGTTLPVVTASRPLYDRSGRLIGRRATIQDVTERKRLEEELKQAQKMEAIGRLAGGIAHDFNNLLTVITGYTEILLHQSDEPSAQREKLKEIKHAGDRAGALTNQLLAFSRKQIRMTQILNVNGVVAGLQSMLQRLIGEHIEVVTALDATLPPISADPSQLEQVVLNLVVNARDAMPNGGKITIETGTLRLDQVYHDRWGTMAPGAYVLLAVSDTGVGMDEATRMHLFEPFFTTKDVGKGTGLGLATVYGIVRQSGGYIRVYSELGQGTTFKIYLPQSAESPGAVPAPVPAEPLPGGIETILLAEDEAGVRNLAKESLELAGYTVITATTGQEALQLAAAYSGNIDLLVTDVVMPQMSGRQLATLLTATRPTLKVLYMSGYTDDAIVEHGVLEPGLAFLNKPFGPASLVRRVRQALDSPSSSPSPAERPRLSVPSA